MTMQKGDRWICSNPICRSEFVVDVGGGLGEGTNPKCGCGSIMKKAYAPPALSKVEDPEEAKRLDEQVLSKLPR